MTVQLSPKAEINLKNDVTASESIEARVTNVTELIDSAITIYENQQIRINQMEDPATKLEDLSNGPWSGSAFAAEEIRIVDGKAQRVGNARLATNSVWDFIFTSPIKDTYSSEDPNVASTITNPVANIERDRYDSIFREHIQRINISGGVKDSITNAVSQLNNLNTAGYQSELNQAKDIIVSPMLEELIVLRDIINAVDAEINNPQSLMYKPGSSFGPYTTEVISAFQMPPLVLEIRNGINSLIPILREVYTRIDEIVNIPEDVLARVSLLNAGLEQSPTDPNQFNLIKPQEKDPWGIRFTYTAQQAGNLYAQQNQVNEFNSRIENNRGNGIDRRNQRERQQELSASQDLLASSTLNLRKDFYFQLLPAIKSNLPVSGGTDVPGAMPGIQFRIENNIVKHKIPGFAPVYQPIGIDSIKCTLVGMFTGSDGVDLSANYLEDLSAGLLNRGGSLLDLPFADGSNYTLAKGGPTLSTFNATNNPFLNGDLDPRNNPLVMNDGVDLPIPSSNRSTTASPVAVISEDAFRGAQDFYNEIVSQGREVEVELNLRKGTGAFPGGTPGPFRDPETGNPKFKGLIKRIDLYYVRRDRCWFIIDLEITDSGLIGNECLNLTNIIEESIDLFEGVTEPIGLTKEQLDECFQSPIEFTLKGQNTGQAIVIDKNTGLSYFYNKANGNLLTDRTYPLSYNQTQTYLYQQRVGGNIIDPKSNLVKNGFWRRLQIVGLMTELAVLYEPALTSKENDFATNWLPADKASLTFHGVAWRYDKNLGKFLLVYDKNGNLVKDASKAVKQAKTLKELVNEDLIDFDDIGSVNKIGNFLLNEYNPLLSIPDNDCSKLLEEVQKSEFNKQDQTSDSQIIEKPLSLPEKTNPDIPGNNTNLTSSPLPQVDVFDVPNATNENFIPPEAIDNVENGVLDRLIEQSINEYLKVLDRNQPAFVGTSLTHELATSLKNQVNNNSLYSSEISGVNLSLVTNRTRVRKNESDLSELSIGIRFTTNKPFYIFRNNNLYKFNTGFSFTGRVIVKSYIENGVKVYKIDGIIIETPRTLRVNQPVEPIDQASNTLEPSANNSPSSIDSNQGFVGPFIDVTTQI